LEPDVEATVAEGAIEARRGEQSWRDKRHVTDAVDARYERADPEPDPEQIKDRLKEPGEDHYPGMFVDQEVALHHAARAIPTRKQHTRCSRHAYSVRRKVYRAARKPATTTRARRHEPHLGRRRPDVALMRPACAERCPARRGSPPRTARAGRSGASSRPT